MKAAHSNLIIHITQAGFKIRVLIFNTAFLFFFFFLLSPKQKLYLMTSA